MFSKGVVINSCFFNMVEHPAALRMLMGGVAAAMTDVPITNTAPLAKTNIDWICCLTSNKHKDYVPAEKHFVSLKTV